MTRQNLDRAGRTDLKVHPKVRTRAAFPKKGVRITRRRCRLILFLSHWTRIYETKYGRRIRKIEKCLHAVDVALRFFGVNQ